MYKPIAKWQVYAFLLMVYDIIAVNGAYFLALWLRFDCSVDGIPEEDLIPYINLIPLHTLFSIVLFWMLGSYHVILRFASYRELLGILAGTIGSSLFQVVLMTGWWAREPVSYHINGTVLMLMLLCIARFAGRCLMFMLKQYKYSSQPGHRAMIIGAGTAGQAILRELTNAKEAHTKPVCVIDDDSSKWNRRIEGVPVVGGRNDILASVERYKVDRILVAMPSAPLETRREILNICKETRCELRNLPGLYQIAENEVSVSHLKNVSMEDLLGREQITVNTEKILNQLSGRTILVTGGGGSIGSELCRQIAKHGPKQLIIFDVYENNAYDIEQELKRTNANLNLTVLIGSVRDTRRINQVFAQYKPEIVFHAAAHKHVPLMEGSPCEAIKNNVMGTYKTACAAMAYGCQRFVLISTDKAVNPTNIMGASKRLCEMVIQSMNRISHGEVVCNLPSLSAVIGAELPQPQAGATPTDFVAVRFGNVLGSNGSVIPLFKKQLEHGGPLTVTHPDIIRYFMTIPEAVSLVLEAFTYAQGGEIFVLDMGAPMKIDTLARNLIKLNGLKPDVDIKIVYTGLRPGEKLYEEKLMAEEGLQTTPNQRIHIGAPIEFDTISFINQLPKLAETAGNGSAEDIRTQVAQIIHTYHPALHGSTEKPPVYMDQIRQLT